MPGRYTITAKSDDIKKRFNVEVPENYHAHFNAAPTQLLPVITSLQPAYLNFFYWGFIPNWSKNKALATKLFNARADSLQDKISFREALTTRRCIIPADGYYEWKSIGKKSKIPYRFTLNSGGLFSLAGLWESSENDNGEEIQTFTVITTDANSIVAQIHDRMPVILTQETEKIWLNPTSDLNALKSVLVPFKANLMTSYAVSSKVNNVANDGPDLIKPAPPADQFGNYSLFD
ncbi:MAG: SOS response-associated peptidase [Cyclobacteriaceae bacterium]|nr:SOS response-associated peptidase [Cyclobacteriaceae bacterium]